MTAKDLNPQKLNPQHDFSSLTHYEDEARRNGYCTPAGVDEAGRGPLAGPVVASACSLPDNFSLPGLKDSKQLTPPQRRRFFECLTTNASIDYGIGIVSSELIDEINILEATKLAMSLAVQKMKGKPDFLLIDAVQLSLPIPAISLIKGDQRSLSIAAASVIAKETRDRLMIEYDDKWPKYGFAKHKGYGTKAHLEAIDLHGPCPIHRFTFAPIKSLNFDF